MESGTTGYIKLYRKMLDNPVVCKDAEHLAIWIYLLLNATHKGYRAIFGDKQIDLRPGQLITGRKSIGLSLNIHESKVQRVLKSFEIDHQIEQQASSRNRLISILNWSLYQSGEQPEEQQMNNERTTSEHKQECKNVKNERKNENDNAIVPDTGNNRTPVSFSENPIVTEAMKFYMQLYRKKIKKDHPDLKAEQYQKCYCFLSDFASENSLDYESLTDMMVTYFNNKALKTDWNINHFATEGILTNRFFEAGLY